MKRTEIAALVLSCGAVALALVQFVGVGSRISLVEERVSHIENPPSAAAGSPPGAAHDSSKEIAALRLEIDSLKRQIGADPSPGMRTVGPGAKIGPPLTPEQEKAKQELAEKQQKEWLERQVRAISDTLEQKLGLTAQQKSGVADVLAGQYAGMTEFRKQNPAPDKVKEMVAKSRTDADEAIKALLTPEQQAQYTQLASGPAGVYGISLSNTAGRLPGEEGSSHK